MSTHVAVTDMYRKKWCMECGKPWVCDIALEEAFPQDVSRQQRYREAASRFYGLRAMGRSYSSVDGEIYSHQQTDRVVYADGTQILIASKRVRQDGRGGPAIGVANVISLPL